MNNFFDPGYLTEDELAGSGFRSLGKNVSISRSCTIIGLGNIAIGDNVRIDSYTTLIAGDTGYIEIGSNVHLGAYCFIAGREGVVLEDFSGLSQGVKIYSASDDYSGEFLTNPTVPTKYLGGAKGKVHISRHAIIGAGSVILPAVNIGTGAAVGSLSLVNKDLEEWCVYFGSPAKKLKRRLRKLLDKEKQYKAESSGT